MWRVCKETKRAGGGTSRGCGECVWELNGTEECERVHIEMEDAEEAASVYRNTMRLTRERVCCPSVGGGVAGDARALGRCAGAAHGVIHVRGERRRALGEHRLPAGSHDRGVTATL